MTVRYGSIVPTSFTQAGSRQKFLLRFAQAAATASSPWIDSAAGKRDLAGMGAHMLAANGQDQAGLARGR